MTTQAFTAVMVDLDSTLCDTSHRHGQSPHTHPTASWHDYAALCVWDQPFAGPIRLVQLLYPHHQIHIVSYRTSSAMEQTIRWLVKHDVPWDALRLSTPEDEEQHNHESYKVQYAKDLRKQGIEPVLMMDDWPAVKRALEAEGVPVLVSNPLYHDPTMKDFVPKGVEDPSQTVA